MSSPTDEEITRVLAEMARPNLIGTPRWSEAVNKLVWEDSRGEIMGVFSPLTDWRDCAPHLADLLADGWVLWQGSGLGAYGLSPDYPNITGDSILIYDADLMRCICRARYAQKGESNE